MAQFIKKVGVTPVRGNGFIIDSFNTNDNKRFNAPSLDAVLDRTDNNLLLCGVFSNFQSGGLAVNGWRATNRTGYTGAPATFSPIVGLTLPANYEGYVTTPKFARLDGNSLDRENIAYSLQVVFGTVSPSSAGYTPIIGKMENKKGTSSPIIDETIDSKLRVQVGTFLGGGGLDIYFYNLTNAPLYINAVKFERGTSCTPIQENGKEYGIYNIVKQYSDNATSNLVTKTANGVQQINGDDNYYISISGALSAVGAWIQSNMVVGKWIAATVAPTDSTGYFGSSMFRILANGTSSNYGNAILTCDNASKPSMLVGKLFNGVWTWEDYTPSDKNGVINIHDAGSTTISISGELSAVGSWIQSNLVQNRWITARVAPTDNTGFFGQTSFTIMATGTSSNYGFAQLWSHNDTKPMLVMGRLYNGSWTWFSNVYEDIANAGSSDAATLSNAISSFFKVRSKTITLPSSVGTTQFDYVSATADISETGYKAIGIVGYYDIPKYVYFTNLSIASYNGVSGAGLWYTVNNLRNAATSGSNSFSVDILYMKR